MQNQVPKVVQALEGATVFTVEIGALEVKAVAAAAAVHKSRAMREPGSLGQQALDRPGPPCVSAAAGVSPPSTAPPSQLHHSYEAAAL